MATASVSVAPEASVARGIGFAVLSYASFSTADAVVKAVSVRYSVFEIALLMSAFAMLPVLALACGQGGLAVLRPKLWGLVLGRGVLTAICGILAWKAFALLPLAEAYAILFASPILVTALSPVLLQESVGWRRWSAAAVGFAGVLVMIRPDFATLELGHALAAGAAVCGALSFIVLRRIGSREPAATILGAIFIAVILMTAPMAIQTWVAPPPQDLLMIGTAGLLMGAGQAGLVLATRSSPAAVVAPFQYTQMIWAIVYGMLLFGDLPEPVMLVGMLLVVASGLYVLWRETVRRRVVTLGAARGEVPARAARVAPD
jgi:S-adenosylmethionine uptake transporter